MSLKTTIPSGQRFLSGPLSPLKSKCRSTYQSYVHAANRISCRATSSNLYDSIASEVSCADRDLVSITCPPYWSPSILPFYSSVNIRG